MSLLFVASEKRVLFSQHNFSLKITLRIKQKSFLLQRILNLEMAQNAPACLRVMGS